MDEYLDGSFVVLVEWPERAKGTDWGRRTWRVRLEFASAEERIIRVQAPVGEGDA
ncbi:MAG: hypothetical protein KatS3mg024_0453 [Armatimonadota bacterium]|nr:MAG: hypothetical protein KatS3mg024_0453 [Armatimonadota bacterium]